MGRVVVTGGAGFIGSHLCETLLQAGHSVIALDNLSCGRRENLTPCLSHPYFSFVQQDINTLVPADLKGVDWVFHLAGLADIVPSIQSPRAYHEANVNGTIAVLEAARAAGVKRFVYAASSSCYGLPDHFPTPESAPMRPMYPYALTKRLGEECVLHWGSTYKLPVMSLRLFNVYGPRSRTNGTYGAVFGVFLAQKLAGKPFTVVGDGTQTRDFTYVTDVARAFVAAAESQHSGLSLNVGSGGTYSINCLVELLGGDVVYIPKRPGEPDCTYADTTAIRKSLDWQPQVSLETGVQRMLDQIEYWNDAPTWDPSSIAKATEEWFSALS